MSRMSTYLGATAAALGAFINAVNAQQGTAADDDDDDSWRWGGGGNGLVTNTESQTSGSGGSSNSLSDTQQLVLVLVGGGAFVVLVSLAVYVYTGKKQGGFVLPRDAIARLQKPRYKWSTWLPVGELT